MKYVLLIGDGMADNAVPELKMKTPLQYAEKPNMDRLCELGEIGSVLTVPKGLAPGSDTAILSIFGYDPRKFYSGRSPLEAAGCGIDLSDGDISYRCNMVAIEDRGGAFGKNIILSHNGGGVDGESSLELIGHLAADPEFSALCEKCGISIYAYPSFRHIAVQKSGDVNGLVTTAPHDVLGSEIGTLLPRGGANGDALARLMEVAFEKLKDHPVNKARAAEGKLPANGVWFWAEGSAIGLPPFFEKFGKTGSVISAVPLVQGIAALAGLRVIRVPGATGELDTNYAGKVEAALKALGDGDDFAVIHVEAPDECTHMGDLNGKITAIEYIDERVVPLLLDGLRAAGGDFRILILSDHKTLMSTRTHDGTPVPFLIYDSRETRKSGRPYDEENAGSGVYIENGASILGRLFGEN